MDTAKKKRLRKWRIAATNIFMAMSVIAIVGILTLLAMGFSFTKDGGVAQSGLVQVKSEPSGALVEIDGESQFDRTEMSKMLSSGTHTLQVTKVGYDTWQTDVDIDAGLLTRIDWIRLFPTKKTIETVHHYNSLRLVDVSPNAGNIILLRDNSAKFQLINIQADEIKYSDLDLSELFELEEGARTPAGILEITQWNKNNDKFILKWTRDSVVDWLLVDTKRPSSSLNLTQEFLLEFDDLQISDDAATKIWAVESQNLRIIRTDNVTISAVLATNVEQLATNGATASYITNTKSGRTINLYKEGEQGSSKLQDLAGDINTVTLAMGSSWKDDWVAYTLNNRFFVIAGEYPSFQTTNKLKALVENDLDFTPTAISASPTGRFVVTASTERVAAADIEMKEHWTYDFASPTINWLDDFILWSDQDHKLSIIDFNGLNQREITSVASGLDVALTRNNHWLYFLQPDADQTGFTLKRERL